jgi:hypothetical protein
MRPWIEDIQKIFPGAPNTGLPETQWGIGILRSILYIVSLAVKSGIFDVLANIGAFGERFSPKEKLLKLSDPSLFERR